jgi:hypothetical protein
MSRRSQERCEGRPGGEWLASPEIFRCSAGSISGQDINERRSTAVFLCLLLQDPNKSWLNGAKNEMGKDPVANDSPLLDITLDGRSSWFKSRAGHCEFIPFFLCRCFRRQNKSWLHRAENQVRRDPAANGSLLPTRIV